MQSKSKCESVNVAWLWEKWKIIHERRPEEYQWPLMTDYNQREWHLMSINKAWKNLTNNDQREDQLTL